MENLAIVIGNLGDAPKLNRTEQNVAVANFSVATTEKWTDKASGNTKERTEWHLVEVWRSLAQACADHLKKGSKVYVKGKMQTTSWEPAKGVRSYKTVIKAEKVKFL